MCIKCCSFNLEFIDSEWVRYTTSYEEEIVHVYFCNDCNATFEEREDGEQMLRDVKT